MLDDKTDSAEQPLDYSPQSLGTLGQLVVAEKDLPDGTVAGGPGADPDAGTDPDTQDVEEGALVFIAGTDAIASVKFDLAANQPTTGTDLDGTISWALSSDGLTLTGSIASTDVITLVLSGDLTATANGGTAEPTVTATLLEEFPHEDVPDADTLTISGIQVVATDTDNDTATATISVEVIDDEPVAITPDPETLINQAGADSGDTLPLPRLDNDGNIDDDVGADQLGTIAFANITDGDQAQGIIGGNTVNLTSGGQNIQLFLEDHDANSATPDRLEGWTGGLTTGTKIFQVTLQPDGSLGTSNDTYTVELFAQIGASQQQQVSDFSALGSSSQQFKALDVASTTQDLLFSGYERASTGISNSSAGSAVQASGTGVGVANQSLNDGDALRIDFVNSATVTVGNNNQYNYTTHYDINNFRLTIVQVNGTPPADAIEAWVRIYNADDDPSGATTATDAANLADDTQLNTITDIKVNGVSLTLGSLTSDGTGGYLIRNLDLNDQILVTASGSGYDRIEIENARSTPANPDASLNDTDFTGFDVGAFAFVTTVTNIPSVDLSFDLALTDADGDSVVMAGAIDITLNAPAPPVVLDLDGDGLEFVAMGDPANQVLFDFNGDGTKETAAWVGPDDGFLVYDGNGDRMANDGSEIAFADMTAEADTDLEALQSVFDSNHDGLLTEADEQFSRFGVWQDANGNGSTEDGEFKTLAERGIVSLDLNDNGQSYSTTNGQVTVHGEASFTYQDGSQGLLGDVSLDIGGPTDSNADSQVGGAGNETLIGGTGNDSYQFTRGDGQDLVVDSGGSDDRLAFGAGINPFDLVLSRQANDLRIAVYGSADQVTVQNWYGGASNQVETIQAGNGQTLVSTQVNQLIDAMASFTSNNNGMAWDQGIAAKPEEVQAVLAASWQ